MGCFFSYVDDVDAKRRQGFEPPEAKARQAVLVLDNQHVEVPEATSRTTWTI